VGVGEDGVSLSVERIALNQIALSVVFSDGAYALGVTLDPASAIGLSRLLDGATK
jgi:hypothetical protein